MGAKPSDELADEFFAVPLDPDGHPSIQVPPEATLKDLLLMWKEDGEPENYKKCVANLENLIEAKDRAMNMRIRRGEKYGEAIRGWTAAAGLVTGSIPSYEISNKAEYPRSKKAIKYYNEIMRRQAEDFKIFAGSLTPIVLSKQIVSEAIRRAKTQITMLESDQKDEPSDESNLFIAALTVANTLPRLVSMGEKFLDDAGAYWKTLEELERKVTSLCELQVSEKTLENLATNLESMREEFILFCEENESIGKRVARILELTKTGSEAEEIKKSPSCLANLEAAKLLKTRLLYTTISRLIEKLSSAADGLTDVVSDEANSIVEKLTRATLRWRDDFNAISKQQIGELRNNVAVNKELKKNNMSILYVSWSDVGRAQGSCGGPNITDMQFFAVPPLKLRPAAPSYLDLDKGLFCNFPAVRSPNFTDEVDIRTASSYIFKVRDLQGEVKEVSMAFFLKNIGRYITDLEPDADWGDEIDLEKDKMQVASQFSVLPLLKCADYKVELGISAFGYQKKNLHIIIGPNGDLGWAPEGPGYKRIFFRDTAGVMDAIVCACEPYFGGSKYICNLISRYVLGFGQELRAIALVPEDRDEVSRSFFKAPVVNESIEEEAKRYAKVENKLIHIQVEMIRGEGKGDFSASQMFSCDGLTQLAKDLMSQKNVLDRVWKLREQISRDNEKQITQNKLDYNSVSFKELPSPYGRILRERYACATGARNFMGCAGEGMANYARIARPSPNLGLLLARVQMGDSVGRANHTDCISFGSTRSRGTAVRVTEMFYSVAKNAEFTQPRIYRFMQQMSFAQRAGDLAHGSLVTDKGSWGDKLPPITLVKGY